MQKKIRILSVILVLCTIFSACSSSDTPVFVLGNKHTVTSVSIPHPKPNGKKYKVVLLSVDKDNSGYKRCAILFTDRLYTVGDTIEIK